LFGAHNLQRVVVVHPEPNVCFVVVGVSWPSDLLVKIDHFCVSDKRDEFSDLVLYEVSEFVDGLREKFFGKEIECVTPPGIFLKKTIRGHVFSWSFDRGLGLCWSFDRGLGLRAFRFHSYQK
jgi:hypothetical protein